MTPYSICENVDTTSGAGTDYPFGAPGCTPGVSGVRVTRSLVLCVRFAIVLFVLRFTDSDYPVGIFKLFVMPISYISFFFLIYIFILLLISKFKLLHKKHNICISMYMYAVVGKWLKHL